MSENKDIKMSSIEMQLKELEDITAKIESGEMAIDEAISLYSDGMKKALICKKALEQMKKKVQKTRDETQDSFNSLESEDTEQLF